MFDKLKLSKYNFIIEKFAISIFTFKLSVTNSSEFEIFKLLNDEMYVNLFNFNF